MQYVKEKEQKQLLYEKNKEKTCQSLILQLHAVMSLWFFLTVYMHNNT